MTGAELYQLIDSPAMLSEKTLPDLKQIVEDFPYFHAARMLYLKNLEMTHDLRLKVELKKMAVQIPDRMKLFFLLEGERYNKQFTLPIEQSDQKKRSPIDEYLSGAIATDDVDSMSSEPFFYESSASLDYIRWLNDSETQPTVTENKMQHQELIDSFIESGSERLGRMTQSIADKKENTSDEDLDKDEVQDMDKVSLDDSYFTETLAHVYIRQKRYEKALEIIRNLSLKYPKKNIYFADQIRFLEKLIIHSKQ